ncbi:DgyrCDS1142 [Dimorphilus gyrociliatus]|uniref:DgyrCDS1142 n=1 Tax=Dimorphilus gyrociliatus TaxID=2664684 RepID=A0A7I8V8G5_9ANNE|nr:DgyrCDS1142 [Dimorphilus gyrociliatus]
MLREIKILILLVPLIQSLPDGAPLSACKNMKPSFRRGSYESIDLEGHLELPINIRPIQGRPRKPPYSIILDKYIYNKNDQITIRVAANQTLGHIYFSGLLLQARKVSCKTDSGYHMEENAVGEFLLKLNNEPVGNALKYLDCFAYVMASWNGEGDDFSGNDDETQRPVLKIDDEEDIQPDTADNVERQAGDIFTHFTHEMHRTHDPLTPVPPVEIPDPLSVEAKIGRRLAEISDTLRLKRNKVDKYIDKLDMTQETAYEQFAQVARHIIQRGEINWGQIVALLYFGYRVGVYVLQRNWSKFFINVTQYVIRFLSAEHISEWIARNGGWRTVLHLVPEGVTTTITDYLPSAETTVTILGASLTVVGAFCLGLWLSRRLS